MPHRIPHAKAYPFPIPDASFIYDNGATRPADPARMVRDGRTPVLAAGSNQSPEQIHRKFGKLPGDVLVPSQRGRLHDFDVVYAAHLAGYGSVPATFQASPGTAVTVFVQWLDEPQLARMHETEGSYSYDCLSGIRIELDDGHGEFIEAFAYSAKAGCLNRSGSPASLAEISAEGRIFPEFTQSEMLTHLRDKLSPGDDLDRFILAHVTDQDIRHARARTMSADALPLLFDREVVDTL
jgi:hypothetical protein